MTVEDKVYNLAIVSSATVAVDRARMWAFEDPLYGFHFLDQLCKDGVERAMFVEDVVETG